MIITWHGDYTIKIVTQGKTIILDPCHPATGLRPVKAKGDVVALTDPANQMSSYTKGIQGAPILINTPGEYSFQDITLYARSWHDEHGHEHNIQRWHIEGVTLLHVGALTRPLEETQLQELEKISIDLLILPVGGGTSLNHQQAMEVLTTIEPRVVIPIHYKLPRLKEKLEGVESFIADTGTSAASGQPKYNVNAKKLPAEGLVTVRLTP